MIGIATPLFDPDGALRIRELPASTTAEVSRRVQRVATLDGGVAINDRGHSAGDRTFTIRWRLDSEAEYRNVQRLVRVYQRLRVASREGAFLAAPQRVSTENGVATLTLLVTEQLN